MVFKWDRKLVESLISLYKKYPILYEKETDGYYDRKQREIALLLIAEEMSKIRPLTVDDVKKKIKTLRSQFSVENVHRYRSLNSGTGNQMFVPKLWCYHLLSFLDKRIQVNTINYLDNDYSVQTPKDLVPKPLKEKNINISTNEMKKSTKLKESTKTLYQSQDVHDAFGKYVASELRGIPDEGLLLEAKVAIQGILSDKNIEIYTFQTFEFLLCIFTRNLSMADDPERDLYPTKEGKAQVPSVDLSVQGLERYISPEKRYGHHLSRTDLEDQFYKFKEENLQLKKAAKKQEEELKRLATKMTRLLREKKSMELTQSPGHKRDLELEEMVEDLQDRIRQLEKTNNHLREKALVAKQQVIMQARRPNPYSHIQPKVNSGNFKSGSSPYVSSINLRGKNLQNSLRKPTSLPIPSYALGLLEEARAELSNLKLLVTNQRNEIEMYQQENEVLKQNMRMREIEFDDELNILKSQLTQKQRQHVQENLDLIRLHRELKQKNTKIMGLQTQYNDMEEKMRILKLNHDHLVKDMDDLALHFKNEQKKSLELLGELKKAEITISASTELQERIKSLTKENDILRETNEKLLKSALAMETERSFSQLEHVYKEKISSLESALEIQTKSKNSLEEELTKERSSIISKEEAHNILKDQFKEMKVHMEQMETKIRFLKSEEVEFGDLQEALGLLKLKKMGKLEKTDNDAERMNNKESKNIETEDIVNRIEETKISKSENVSVEIENADETKFAELENLKSRLTMVETEHFQTLQELDNVREVLITQRDINKIAQDEIKLLTQQLEEQQKEFQTQLQECSHLLDLRAARIQKLEKQLNDIAYGTLTTFMPGSDAKNENSDPVKLNKGENIFEIHIQQVKFTAEGLRHLSNPNAKIFLTWNFYEFELQSTPVVPAEKPFFNFTAQYTVEVDDYFLCSLHENAVTFELHESIGVDYKTLSSCSINFSNIFTKSEGRILGTQKLLGTNEEKNVEFGIIDYWIQLKIPVEDALKFFKERIKALKYIHSNKGISTAAVNLLTQPHDKNSYVNELHVKILRGINLKPKQKDVQPTTFCVYKFYDLPDQDTAIIPSSNNPEYSDHHIFSLFVDPTLEKYIMTENLYVYVFDDNDPDISNHIGQASIPLQPLVQNKPIKGIFELQKGGKTGCGAIEILIYWQFDYSVAPDTLPYNKMKEESFSFVPPATTSSLSSSDEEMTAIHEPVMDVSVMTPPVPKPRKSIPSNVLTSSFTMKKYDTSNGDSSSHLSLDSSPVHHENQFTPLPAKRMIQNSIQNQPSRIENHSEKNQNQEEDWSDVMSDTEKKASYEETTDQEKQDLSYENSDSESDDYSVYGPKRSTAQVPTIVIHVSHLQLRADAAVLQDPLIKLLYVEYRFLDYPLEELETPFSLPKKEPPEKIVFNFEKTLTLNLKDLEKWNLLSKMLTSDSPEASLIRFTVVSEPLPDEQSLDCEDIGYGSVDLSEILYNKQDKIQEDILIYDARDTNTVIGSLNISIKALDALILLQTFSEL
ncbi:protein fantom [Nephila pilipes]|uniref:Protein fantom n=1 Tax=Nephila pilipes TaxID=299642 RepID=A0A8X6N2E8_NEPPI|nr:protein fantom [Nephila pilipes]